MTGRPQLPEDAGTEDAVLQEHFDRLFSQVDGAAGFGHREHLHLTWLAVRQFGADRATLIVGHGLRRVAAYARMPQKYHETVSPAWVLLLAHHVGRDPVADFRVFLGRNQGLLDKRLLNRFYRSSTLAAAPARTSWVEPDLAPLPT